MRYYFMLLFLQNVGSSSDDAIEKTEARGAK